MIYRDEEFSQKMTEEIPVWVEKQVHTGMFSAYDGLKLAHYYALAEQNKGTVIFCHGFGEFFGKYHELLHSFWQDGYNVFFLEQRGHGKSGRQTKEEDHVFVRSFDDYVRDFRQYLDAIERLIPAGSPRFLFAHSMGGATSALLLEENTCGFRAAALSSPMFRLKYVSEKPSYDFMLNVLSRVPGMADRLLPGEKPFDGVPTFATSSASSEQRYLYQFAIRQKDPACRAGKTTFAWARAAVSASKKALRNASAIKIPILVLTAGNDALIDNRSHDEFAAAAGNVTRKVFPRSRHELYNAPYAITGRWYQTILDFFKENS